MKVNALLAKVEGLIGSVQAVEGMLMENSKRPFLGQSTTDWTSGKCVQLCHEGLFDLLFDLLFPNIIGGGDTLYFYPASAVGQINWDVQSRVCSLTELRSISVDVRGQHFDLNLLR